MAVIALAVAPAAGGDAPAEGLPREQAALPRSILIDVRPAAHEGPVGMSEAAIRLYNDACRRCREGAPDDAAPMLLAALRAGFDDVSHLRRDADLAPLRAHPVFQAILAARDAADATLARRRLDAWRAAHDPADYLYEADPARRLTFASALPPEAHRRMREQVAVLADHLAATLFAPPRHEILLVLPTAPDAAALLPDPHAHGHYSHRARRLVAREPGRALRHELVHALHHAHMDSLGQEHPAWIQEGLACLYESWTARDGAGDGTVAFPANDRDDAARLLAARGRLLSWRALAAMDGADLSREAARAYPQLRSMFRFIADEGGVRSFYHACVRGFGDDPSGVAALEAALGRPLDDLEREWRRRLAPEL